MRNKINIGNPMKLGQLLEFEVAFPNEKKLPIEEYLRGGSRELILIVAAFFLGFKNQKSKYSDNREFLGMLFGGENNELANQIYYRIKEIENKGTRIGIINSYSSLKLFEIFFSRPEEPETQTKAEFEVNIFKAYLVLNSEYTQKQSVAFSSSQKSDEELKFPMLMFCMQYPVTDKEHYDIKEIWVTQMIKSIYLFQFLESDEKAKFLLEAFLAYFNCDTWQDYLKSLLPLTMPSVQNENEAHTDIVVQPGEKFEQECAFIEKLIVQEQDELDSNDFLSIRAKPFYKVKDGVYRIIFNLFVVEKTFKGVYFLLRDVNKTLPTANRIKEIKSFYGDEFSEKTLCYKVMESIYPEKCIRFSGKELVDKKIDAAPDYYVRRGKNIILVESKDFLIAADKKMSFDFNIYEREFAKILDYEDLPDGKRKPKAVIQLINNIRRILKNEFSADTDINCKEVFIFPVLLTHDLQFDTPGFNELIDFWFQDELLGLEEEGIYVNRVKPLSVVNIDSLIFHQHGLSKYIPFHEMLNLYNDNKKLPREKKRNFKSQEEYDRYLEDYRKMWISKLIPFSFYIDKYFSKEVLRKPPILLDMVAPALFNDEFQLNEAIKS